MDFMTAINNQLGTLTYNKSITENGAIGYKSTQKSLLDMNFKTASYRNAFDEEIVRDFIKAYNENPLLAIKWVFYARDVRGGMGERRLFRVIMKYLATAKTETVKKLLPLFAEYGRWDDVLDLIDTPVKDTVFKLVETQLTEDINNLEAGKSVSLLGKWMPSINTSSKETVALAKKFATKLGLNEKQYRKTLSALRAKIAVVEKDMSAGNWEGINYEAVTSKANLNYNNAFLRHDEERRRAYLGALEKGEVKINSSTLFPHEIFHKYGQYARAEDPALEAMWKALPEYGLAGTLVVVDGSISMTCARVSNTSAWEVANALGTYCAERNKGAFKNSFITFSSHPELVTFNKNATLADKIRVCNTHRDCSNTNIEATFDLILNTAKANRMTQEDLPKNVLIISDMEFDNIRRGGYSLWGTSNPTVDEALFEVLQQRFEDAGYKMPRLCFWNVASRTGTIPVMENDLGVSLISGFSPAVLKMVMSNKLDAYECLVEQLNAERYAPIEKALNS